MASLLSRVSVFPNPRQTVRLVGLSAVAVGVLACAVALYGWWSTDGLLTVSLLVLIASVLVYQVRWAIGGLRDRSADLAEAASRAERHYVDVLQRIMGLVEARDTHWNGHSRRVGGLAERIAGKLGLPRETAGLLGLAGRLHDIGLLAVPAATVKSSSHFGADEFRSVQKHSEVSYEVLRPLRSLEPVLLGIRHHHERMNGTGYPGRLAGEAIPLEARILAVADAYDAMTHDRPHRAAVSSVQAVQELRRCTPSGFDPKCVDALAEVLHLAVLEDR